MCHRKCLSPNSWCDVNNLFISHRDFHSITCSIYCILSLHIIVPTFFKPAVSRLWDALPILGISGSGSTIEKIDLRKVLSFKSLWRLTHLKAEFFFTKETKVLVNQFTRIFWSKLELIFQQKFLSFSLSWK